MPDFLKPMKTKKLKTAESVFAHVDKIYTEQIDHLRDRFQDFIENKINAGEKVQSFYPYVRIQTKFAARRDSRLSYGFVSKPGTYSTTITRPDIFKEYFIEQFKQLLTNHEAAIEVGLSNTPIPVHFALGESFHLEGELSPEQLANLPEIFDVPNLDIMDDEIANSTYIAQVKADLPLSLFTAPRVDISLQRLRHYSGTSATHFQNFVIFTNYQFYIDQFVTICRDLMTKTEDPALKKERSQFLSFVEPGSPMHQNENIETQDTEEHTYSAGRMPQMPAYHLKMPNNTGITMVNIGVGPSNAKTITDHIAVLRPHAWLMLGHCAGLRNSQRLGDYVLAHGYLREDNILDEDLSPSIPIPPLAEIQMALEKAVQEVTGKKGYETKSVMRTGTVATTDDRNWELRSTIRQNRRLSQSRAIAMDMESGTIAANGFRFRVPYGTLLCVSDKPLHGQLKLPGMADTFYRERVEQHLQIGLLTMTLLRDLEPEKLHSRKLRSFNEVAFQ